MSTTVIPNGLGDRHFQFPRFLGHSLPVSIVIRDSQKESIQQLLNIYGKSLSYAIIEDDVLDSLELKFVPAYILLDKGRKVRFCEPYPNTILRYIEE